MIGRGYHACRTCHYSTDGGGPTTAYGKGIAGEMSTWSYEGEGDAFYGVLSTDPLAIHADFRQLYYRYQDNTMRIEASFPMQREVSVSLDAAKNVSLLSSCGYYGYSESPKLECRRYFATVSLGPLRFRGGRFLPAFGLNIPDHTKAIKELFGQGKESLNAETSILSRYFEIIYTRMLGRRDTRIEGDSGPYISPGNDGDGFSVKGSLFLGRGVQLGYSYAALEGIDGSTEIIQAYDAFWGTEKFSIFGEMNTSEGITRGYASLGVQPVNGLWFKAETDYRSEPSASVVEVYGTFQWFPRPHTEFLLSASEKRVIFISHYYL